MDEDAEERGGLFVWVFLQLGLDLDDECRGHGGEQTSLSLELGCVRRVCLKTHKYQGGVQIFVVSLDEFLVVFVGLLVVVLVEFSAEILLGRLSILSRAVGGGTSVCIGSDGRLDATHQLVSHSALHLLHYRD